MAIGPEYQYAARLAQTVMGLRARREIITPDARQSVRWQMHDYPNAIAGWNYHPEYEIHLLRRGTGRFIVGDRIGTYQAGEVFLIGSGLPHDWVSDLDPGEFIANRDAVIQFDGQWLQRCMAVLPELREVSTVLERSARGIRLSGPSAQAAARHIEAFGGSVGLDRLPHLFALLATAAGSPEAEQELLAREWFQPQLDAQAEAVVDMLFEYLFSEHGLRIRMSEAARLVGMSESHFSRYFKRSTGQNFSEVARKLRIAHASTLLEQSDLPISALCYEVGFSNLSNFNRQFRADTGMTPSEFRRRRRQHPVRESVSDQRAERRR